MKAKAMAKEVKNVVETALGEWIRKRDQDLYCNYCKGININKKGPEHKFQDLFANQVKLITQHFLL